jgi:hypothetical protein
LLTWHPSGRKAETKIIFAKVCSFTDYPSSTMVRPQQKIINLKIEKIDNSVNQIQIHVFKGLKNILLF